MPITSASKPHPKPLSLPQKKAEEVGFDAIFVNDHVIVSDPVAGTQNRFRSSLDAPPEGNGFEPSVPGTKEPVFVAEGELRDRTG
jgi:hypothetical protein